ncbi:carboxypeptidase-like regulatory domain-containing protein [Schlesneria paludicola]|uniref:carboxypeptidase-like regulatory domain-containing protein n=1 Tax=Schlesneria paludicola TaxID=360056 RepID=UPI00029AD820|nr:carboxypeptidase-like regulatory domain-containing protein [Schlesneria paludicola]
MIPKLISNLFDYLRTPAARSAQEFGDAIEDEIAFHLAERTDENVARGMSPEQARREAMASFGDASKIAAQCHREAVHSLALWHRVHLGMTACLAVSVAALWFGASKRALRVPTLELAQLPPGIATMLAHDWTGDLTGRIVDEEGRPIPNAQVLAVVKTWPDQSYFQRAFVTATNAGGQFSIENVHPIDELYECQLAVIAEKRLLKSAYYGNQHGTFTPVTLQLPPASSLTLRVESDRGETLAGVDVLPHRRVEPGGEQHQVYFDSAQSIISQTDREGCATLPYFSSGDIATVLLRGKTGEWQTHDVTVPAAGETITIRMMSVPASPSEES